MLQGMNWFIFILAAYVCLALQTGLRTLIELPMAGGVDPSFVLVLGVFIGLLAPASTVGWAMLVLGVLVDLTTTLQWANAGAADVMAPVVGPHAVAYVVGAYAVVQLRTLVFRESVLSLAMMTFSVGLFVLLARVVLMAVMNFGWTWPSTNPGFSAAEALFGGFLSLLYTTAMALPLGALLLRTTNVWAFAGRTSKHY